MGPLLKRKKTKFCLAFSAREQSLACLSAVFASIGYQISAAEIRNNRPFSQCDYQSLPKLADEIGIPLDTFSLVKSNWHQSAPYPLIVLLKNYGAVILDSCNGNQICVNHPIYGWMTLELQQITDLLLSDSGYSLKQNFRFDQFRRRKPSFLYSIILSDRSLLILSLAILLVSVFYGLTSLLDPVMKNIYFTNVIQMSMKDWAKPIAILYFLAAVVVGIFLIMSTVLSALLTNRMALKVAFSAYSSTLRLPSEYLDNRQTGDLMSRVRSSEALASFIGSSEIMLLGSMINLCLLIGVLISISPILSILLITFQAVGLVVVFISNPGFKERADQLHNCSAKETSSFIRLFGSIRLYQALRKDLFGLRFHILHVSRRIRAQQQLTIYRDWVTFISSTIDKLQSAVLLTSASILIVDGRISLGEYIAFSAMLSLVISPMKRFSQFILSLQQIRTIHERVLDVCEEASLASNRSIRPTLNQELLSLMIANPAQLSDLEIEFPQPLVLKPDSSIGCLHLSSSEEMIRAERLLSGDVLTPTGVELRVDFSEGVKKVLVARTDPHIFSMGIIENITLKAHTGSAFNNTNVADLINKLQPDLLSPNYSGATLNLSNVQKHRLGILRALSQSPDVLFVSTCLNTTQQEEVLLHRGLHEICKTMGVRPFLITNKHQEQNELWGDSLDFSPWLNFLQHLDRSI